MNNPYPEILKDDCTPQEFEDPRHKAWQEGYDARCRVFSEPKDREQAIEKIARRLCLQTEGRWEDCDEDVRDRCTSQSKELVEIMEQFGYSLPPELSDEEREQLAEYDLMFSLRHKADMRAIKMWRKGHPERSLVLPDHADMVCWLLERLCQAQPKAVEG